MSVIRERSFNFSLSIFILRNLTLQLDFNYYLYFDDFPKYMYPSEFFLIIIRPVYAIIIDKYHCGVFVVLKAFQFYLFIF